MPLPLLLIPAVKIALIAGGGFVLYKAFKHFSNVHRSRASQYFEGKRIFNESQKQELKESITAYEEMLVKLKKSKKPDIDLINTLTSELAELKSRLAM